MTIQQIEQNLTAVEVLGDSMIADTLRAMLERIATLETRLQELEGELCPSGADSPFRY